MHKTYEKTLRFCLRVAFVAGVLLAAIAPLACEKPASEPEEMESEKTKYDEDYIAALKAANLFCQHWLLGDYPVAKMMLTKRLRHEHSEQRLKDVLGGVGNPRHAAYEVYGGRKLDDTRITFKVRLFQVYIGQGEKRIEAPAERIVLIKESKNNWLVDEFPIP